MRLTPNSQTETGRGRLGQPLAATLFSLALVAWSAGILPGALEALDAADAALSAAVESGERFINDLRLLLAVAEVSEGGVAAPAAAAEPTVLAPRASEPADGGAQLEWCELDGSRQVVAPQQKKL
jgi:hypothetical protein